MTWRIPQLTLPDAKRAIRCYNSGLYYGVKNVALDRLAYSIFRNGLGKSQPEIEAQLKFIGRKKEGYGGVAGFQKALNLSNPIGADIYSQRRVLLRQLNNVQSVLAGYGPTRDQIEILFAPFRKSIHDKENWVVWAFKFWHFVRHDAFPILDSRSGSPRVLAVQSVSDPIKKYETFVDRFCRFHRRYESYIPDLQKVDGGHVGDDNVKLWDKVFYQLGS